MGCHLPQNKQEKSIIQRKISDNKVSLNQEDVPLNNCYYELMQFQERISIQSAFLFNIGLQRYILLDSYEMKRFIYDIDFSLKMECDLSDVEDLKSVFTNKNCLFIQTQEYLFQLILIGKIFLVKKRYLRPQKSHYMKFLFVNQYSDLFLEVKLTNSQLRSLKLQKQIVKLTEKNITYDKNKSMIISSKKSADSQQFINIINIQNRQIVIRQLLSGLGSKLNLEQIVLVQNTDDILIEIEKLGLFLYTVNYQDKKIERIKLLNCNVQQICIFDDKNLLNLMTEMFFIRFDKQYNIIQRFRINYDNKNDFEGNEVLQSLSKVKIIQNLPELFCFKQIPALQSYQLYKLKKSYQKQETDLCFTSCQIYQINYSFKSGQKQHLLSQNQKYLAFIICQSLIFHYICDRSDQQIRFSKKILFLNFSINSNYLYVSLGDVIQCYKTQQNLKKCYEQHNQAFKILTNSLNFIIAQNKNRKVCVYNKQSNKLIFKLPSIQYDTSFDYQPQNGIILVRNEDELYLFNLVDRKLLSTTTLRNKQCQFIPNSQNVLILTKKRQLQLWNYKEKDPILEKTIMDKVRIILQGYDQFYCLQMLNLIIILDKNFQITEQIYYQETQQREQDRQFDSQVINEHDQIIQRNLLVRVTIHINTLGRENIILSIESREQTNN